MYEPYLKEVWSTTKPCQSLIQWVVLVSNLHSFEASNESWSSTAKHFKAASCFVLGQVASHIESRILREQKWEVNGGCWSHINVVKCLSRMNEEDLEEAESSRAKMTWVRYKDCHRCTHSFEWSEIPKVPLNWWFLASWHLEWIEVMTCHPSRKAWAKTLWS